MKLLFSKRMLMVLYFISLIVLFVSIHLLGVLTPLYEILFGVVLLFIYFIFWHSINKALGRKKRDNKKFSLIFHKFICILLICTNVFMSFYAIQGNNFFSMIGGSQTQKRIVDVIVMSDSSASTIDDVKMETFAIEQKTDVRNINTALKQFEEKASTKFDTQSYDNYLEMVTDLYNGDIEVIIADQAYVSVVEEQYPHFASETKVIDSVEIEVTVVPVTTSTNVTKNPFIVYVTGIDVYGDVSTVSRSDVNLVAVVNPNTKQVLLVSIPRDMQITLPSYNAMDKLTHSAVYGIEETMGSINDLFEIEINYYAKTNFSGIIDIVDSIGGVTIDSPFEFTTMHGNYDIVKGINEMDGDMALSFVRERYALPAGDVDRAKNQQLLLEAMLDKMMSASTITRFSGILQAIQGSFETSMSEDEMKSLLNMQVNDMASWDIIQMQLTGVGEDSYDTYSMEGQKTFTFIPDETELQEIIDTIDKVMDNQEIEDTN